MKKKIYCEIGGKRKEVKLGMLMPFPEQYHSKIDLPYPKRDPVFLDNKLIMLSRLMIPINGTECKFEWDVWVSVDKEEVSKCFNIEQRDIKVGGKPNMLANLESQLLFHPNSSGLKIQIEVTDHLSDELPPIIILADSELKSDQENGVSEAKVYTATQMPIAADVFVSRIA